MATMFPNISTQQGYRAPGPYDEDYRSIARREQLAQILQQQALQPIEAGSYQGIQAPISPLSGIAKVLQGYLAGRQSDDADQARQDLALKAQNADLALSNLPPIEAKPKQLAQALTQAPSNATVFSEGSAFTPTQQLTEPVAQAMPISTPNMAQAPQTGQVAPQSYQMPMLSSDQRLNAQLVRGLGGQEYLKLLAKTLEPTPEMKNIAAVFGKDSSEYKTAMANVAAKSGYIASENLAPGAIALNPLTKQFVASAPKDGVQSYPIGNGQYGAREVPGFSAANANVVGSEKLATGLASMATTPEATINTAGEKVTGGTQFSNIYGSPTPNFSGTQSAPTNVQPKVLAPSPVMQAADIGLNEDWRKDVFGPAKLQGQTAQRTLDSVSVLRNTDLQTGFGTETKANIANMLAAVGVKDAEKFATSAQIFQKEGSKALLDRLASQKGPQTERDAITGRETFVTLSDTPQAKDFTLDLAQAMALQDQRKSGYFQKATDMPQVHKGKLGTISTEWSKIEGSVFDMPIGRSADGKPITMRQKYGIK
jgi:hypothetical protein